jgi:hypothetical protein
MIACGLSQMGDHPLKLQSYTGFIMEKFRYALRLDNSACIPCFRKAPSIQAAIFQKSRLPIQQG